jgi:DNA-directed RNA polymerase subunit RPC12/RpoP
MLQAKGEWMKFVLLASSVRVCSKCGSPAIYKSRRKGPLEFILRWVFQISPYRCTACDYRHFRFRFEPPAKDVHHVHPV